MNSKKRFITILNNRTFSFTMSNVRDEVKRNILEISRELCVERWED